MDRREYFKKNRYLKEYFLNELSNVNILEDTLKLSINDIKIEIYIDEESKDREYIKEVLCNIEYIDNYVQEYCEENFKRGNLGFKAYAVGLSWIDIEKDKVTIRYCGEYVNIELEVIYIKLNDKWIVQDIYYC